MGSAIFLHLSRYTEDHALQFGSQFVAGLIGQLRHIRHIHTGSLRDGDGKGFTGGIHGVHRLVGLDGALGEHIRLAFQLAVLVNDFQRAEQIVAGIIGKGQSVRPVIDKTIFCGKAVIEPVQFRLFLGNGAVWNRCIHLKVDQFLHTISQSHKTFYAGFCCGIQVRAHHAAVFTEIYSAVHHGVGVIFHIGVGRNGGVDGFALTQLRQLGLLVSAANVLHGIMQLIGKLQPLNGIHGVVHAMGGAFRFLSAQHHFRVVQEVAVDGKAVLRRRGLRLLVSALRRKARLLRRSSFSHKVLRLCGNPDNAGLGPFRHDVQRAVPLLEEDDVRYHLGTGILFERIIRQTDSSQQLGTLSKIPAHSRVLGVHRIAGGYKSHHAAGTHLVECFGKKVVVDAEIQLVIGFISNLILTERHITNGKVIEISPVGGLKPGHGDVGLGVELFCNPSADGIQLHAIQTAVSHFLRQHTEEVAHTAGRLQDVSGLKSHTVHRFIDGLNDRRAGVMGVEGRASGGSIFFRGQQLSQLGIFRSPCGLLRVKGVGQTAPAHIPGKNFLLLRRCLFSGFLQIFQQLDCRDIGLKLGFRTAFAQVVVGDTEILSGAAQVVLVFLIRCFLGSFGIGEGLPLAVYLNGNGVFVQHFIQSFFRLSGRCRRLWLIGSQGLDNHIIRQMVLVTGINCHRLSGKTGLCRFRLLLQMLTND